MPKISQKNLLTKVYKNVITEELIGGGDTVIVALSGGPDSVCLFDVLFKLRDKLKIDIKACHFNHKLRGAESEADAKFVEKLCKDYGVELITDQWKNKPEKKGCNTQAGALGIDPLLRTESLTIGSCNKKISEDEAREARYEFFSKISKSERGVVKIALAHHSNDLAETFLMRIIRGTGLKGLKSIPSRRENFIRPLLKFSRDNIIDYLEVENINYRTDKSNDDVDYFRNKIRHKLLPDLKEINPNIIETLQIASLSIGDDYDYISAEAEKKLVLMVIGSGDNRFVLDYKKWIVLHPSLQRLVLRLSIERLRGGEDINYSHIERARELLIKKVGKKSLPLPHHLQIRLERGRIIILKNKAST
jgi:tRNA(Ile)-lysidine synthase